MCLGILANGIGAFSRGASRWNLVPVDVDRMPSRIWDWRDPQLLAWRHPERRTPKPEETGGRDEASARADERQRPRR